MIDNDMTVQQMLDKLAESYEMDESALSRSHGLPGNCSQEGMISLTPAWLIVSKIFGRKLLAQKTS